MSAEATKDQAPQTTVGDVLFSRVYVPAFLQKCAELGIVVNSDEEVADLLEIAARVKLASHEQSQVQANSQASFLKQAKLAIAGTEQPAPASIQGEDEVVNHLLQDQEVKAALAVLGAK